MTPTATPPLYAPRTLQARQRGMALVMGLIILVLMTMLGVSVMNTTLLGSRMATNNQEMNRALFTAESGLEQGFKNPNSYVGLQKPGDLNTESTTINNGSVSMKTTFSVKGEKVPRSDKLENTYSVTQLRTANFEQNVTAVTNDSQASATIRQGVTQIIPKE